jgi:hypothetical protein
LKILSKSIAEGEKTLHSQMPIRSATYSQPEGSSRAGEDKGAIVVSGRVSNEVCGWSRVKDSVGGKIPEVLGIR